jgi:hypothetical protein
MDIKNIRDKVAHGCCELVVSELLEIIDGYEAMLEQVQPSPAVAVPDGLNELIASCRQIGFPVVSDGMKIVIDEMQSALRRVQNSIASPPPRITEQDAIEIINDFFLVYLKACPSIKYDRLAANSWLSEQGRALLSKLNDKPEISIDEFWDKQ